MTTLPIAADQKPGASPKLSAMRIGELAKVSGKTARALRLYEEMGLLTPGERTSGNFRVYGAEAIDRVMWITQLQDLGLTLSEIQTVVETTAADGVPRESMARARAMFESRLAEVSAQLTRLQNLRGELRSALAFLDGCTECSVVVKPACSACDEQELVTPGLVRGLVETAREHSSEMKEQAL